MDNRFFGGIASYVIAILFLAGGIGAFFYLKNQNATGNSYNTSSSVVNITPDSGYDWNKISDGMHVTLTANNNGGYYEYPGKGDKPGHRIYFVYNYSQKTNSYDRMIGVWVEPSDYNKWESLEFKLSKDAYLPTITVTNYVRSMTGEEYSDIRNTLLLSGDYDVDETMETIVPYIIAPSAAKEAGSNLPQILCYIAMGLGGVLLLGSIIGSIARR